MRAAAKAMSTPFPGEVEVIQPNTNDTNWRVFALRNSHLSKMIQEVHNTGLGSLELIYLSVIAPLSVEDKLTGVGAVVNLALNQSTQNERSQALQAAGADLIWLFRLANETFEKESSVVEQATANLTEYLRLINRILKWKTPCDPDSFESFGISTSDLRKLHVDLQKELKNADPALQELLRRKYKVLGPTRAPSDRDTQYELLDLLNERGSTRKDLRDILRRTATHYAGPFSPAISVFETILERQRENDAQDLLGRTALHYTCFCDFGTSEQIEQVDRLIWYGAELDTRARDGATPLHYAAMTGRCAEVTALVKAGATVDALDLSGRSPFHTAAVHGHKPILEVLLEKADKNLQDRSGWSAVHLAAMSGEKDALEFLFQAGVDQEAKDRGGRDALHLAAIAGKGSVMAFLLSQGTHVAVHIDERDHSDMSALYLAAEAGHESAVEILIQYGANKEAETLLRDRPLGAAVAKGHEGVARFLLHAGVRSDWEDALGQNLLHRASAKPNTNLVEEFLGRGLDVNSEDERGASPLHFAAKHGRLSNGRLLLDEGARIEQNDQDGETPLWHAVIHRRASFVRFLLQEGARIDVTSTGRSYMSQDDPDTTLLATAKKRGHKKIIDLLERHLIQNPDQAIRAREVVETPHTMSAGSSLSADNDAGVGMALTSSE
jgi:ankyrin repeat protein